MLGESAQMWSESAIPRVATCLEDEEIIHFDLSRFLCLARTDKQMVGRTSFNHVQTPLTFDNVSRILFLQVGRALAPLRSAAWDITRDGEKNHQKSELDARLPEVSRSAHHWEWPVIQCCRQAKASWEVGRKLSWHFWHSCARDIAQAGCSEETIKARVATGSLSASVRYVLCLGCFGMLNFEKVDGAAETALLQSSPFAALLGWFWTSCSWQ